MEILKNIQTAADVRSALAKISSFWDECGSEYAIYLWDIWDLQDASPIKCLFKQAQKLEMYEEVEQYLENYLSKFTELKKDKEFLEAWYDDQYPIGSFAAEILADRDVKNIGLYIRYLHTCDLGHEVEQSDFIRHLVERYGLCQETYRLIVERACSCCGQHGQEDLMYLNKKYDLGKWIEANELIQDYANSIFEYWKHDPAIENEISGLYVDELELYFEEKQGLGSFDFCSAFYDAALSAYPGLDKLKEDIKARYFKYLQVSMMTSIEDYDDCKPFVYQEMPVSSDDWIEIEVKGEENQYFILTMDLCARGEFDGKATKITLELADSDGVRVNEAIARTDSLNGRRHAIKACVPEQLKYRLKIEYSGSENDFCSFALLCNPEIKISAGSFS